MKQRISSASGNGFYTIDEEKKSVVFTFKAYNKMFYGKSVCSNNDVFNVETGMRIAYLKALKKMKMHRIEQLQDMRSFLSSYNDMYNFDRFINMIRAEEIICEDKIHSFNKQIYNM